MEQASGFQGNVGVNDGAAADNLDSSGTVEHTRNVTAGTVFGPRTESLVQPRVPSGTVDVALEMEAQTDLAPNPASMSLEPTTGTVHPRERPRSPRRHEEEEPFGLTSVHSVFVMRRFGAGDVAVGRYQLTCIEIKRIRAGSRQRQERMLCTVSLEDIRLKLVNGDPTMCLVPLSASRSSRIPKSNRYRPQVVHQDDSPA